MMRLVIAYRVNLDDISILTVVGDAGTTGTYFQWPHWYFGVLNQGGLNQLIYHPGLFYSWRNDG